MRGGVIASSRRYLKRILTAFMKFRNRVLGDKGVFEATPIDFNNEELLLTPNATKVGKLYSALPMDGSGDFTVLRNSIATYIGQDGLMKTAQPNEPRIDWSTGEPTLLVEPQATNLVVSGEMFSGWQLSGGSSIQGGFADPKGGYDATKLIGSGVSSRIQVQLGLEGSIVQSLYIKYAGSDAEIFIRRDLLSDRLNLLVTAQGVSLGTNSQSGNIHGYNITHVGSGWYRVSSYSNIGMAYYQIYVTTHTIYAYGAQVEQGLCETSYIPTNGTSVTRLADTITVTPPHNVREIFRVGGDGSENTTIIIPEIYDLPQGNIKKLTMSEISPMADFRDRVEMDGGVFEHNSILYNKETLLLTPNATKVGKLYSALPMDGGGDFTVSRNSIARYFDKDVILQVAQPNEPRIDWLTGEPILLIEPPSTNLIINSMDISSPKWAVLGGTLEKGFPSPDGLNNATKYKTNSIIPTYNLFREQSTYTEGHTISIYVKNIDAEYFYTRGYGYYDFLKKSCSHNNMKATDVGNEWVKLDITGVNQTAYTQFGIGKLEADREAVDQSVLIFAPQREVGAMPSSYIPTNGTTVTRLGDIIKGNVNSDIFKSGEGTLYIDIKANSMVGENASISINNGSTNVVRFVLFKPNRLNFHVISGGVSIVSTNNFTFNFNTDNRIAISYKINQFWLVVNGVTIVEQLSGDAPINLNRIDFSRDSGTTWSFSGGIKSLKYFGTASTEQELINMTKL